jgi:type III secretory pathway component EscU
MKIAITQLIQTMIAPAVMISSCGLLLMALVSKLGRVIDRIRILNAELRAPDNELTQPREVSIKRQIEMMVYRALILKRSSAALFLAILFFILTSFGIGLSVFWQPLGNHLALAFFIIGMICLLLGAFYAYLEIRVSHTTIVEEIKEAVGTPKE